MINCKNCGAEKTVKSGFVRGKQRYKCKDCNCFFVIGDERTSEHIAALKALCVLFYSLGQSTYGELGKLFNRDKALIYRWGLEEKLFTKDPITDSDIKEMTFDEMLNFVSCKKPTFTSKKPLTVVHGNLWPGYSAIIIIQPSLPLHHKNQTLKKTSSILVN